MSAELGVGKPFRRESANHFLRRSSSFVFGRPLFPFSVLGIGKPRSQQTKSIAPPLSSSPVSSSSAAEPPCFLPDRFEHCCCCC